MDPGQIEQVLVNLVVNPGYRRLRYVRYADDFVLGFSGPKAEAEQIKESLETFLRDTLKLELSREKTLITHATSQAAKFLGYELVNQQVNDKIDHTGRRSVNGRIGLRGPAKVIEQHCRAYMRNGKPADRPVLIHDTDYSIVARYQAEFRAHDLINMVTERENVPQNCGYRGPGGNREPREHQGVRGAAAGEVPEGHQG